ncbi:MAG: hypothetical protein AAGJ35_14890, partial [Myxococcota bacterium]
MDREDVFGGDIICVQRDANGTVLVTFKTVYGADLLLEDSVLQVDGKTVSVEKAAKHKTYVKIHYLPHEVPNEAVLDVLGEYGRIAEVRLDCHPKYPNILSGTRTVTMYLEGAIPSRVNFAGYEASVWYKDQVQTCRHCGEAGHLFRRCPQIRCRMCHQLGHLQYACPERMRCDECGQMGHSGTVCRQAFPNLVATTLGETQEETQDEPQYETQDETQDTQEPQDETETQTTDVASGEHDVPMNSEVNQQRRFYEAAASTQQGT